MLGYFLYAIGADDGAAAGRLDVCENRKDEESLFGRVEVVCEEVAVGVPASQVVRIGNAVVAGQRAEVYDEIILLKVIVLVVTVLESMLLLGAG